MVLKCGNCDAEIDLVDSMDKNGNVKCKKCGATIFVVDRKDLMLLNKKLRHNTDPWIVVE